MTITGYDRHHLRINRCYLNTGQKSVENRGGVAKEVSGDHRAVPKTVDVEKGQLESIFLAFRRREVIHAEHARCFSSPA